MRSALFALFVVFALLVPASVGVAQPIEEGPIEEGPIEEGPVDETEPEEPPPITVFPKLETLVQATYPARAFEEGVESSVVLEIDIDTTGKVEAVSVKTSATPTGYGFDEAALEAARQFVFSPAEAGGKPVPVRITYTYTFVLETNTLEPPPEEDPLEETAPGIVNYQGLVLERGTRTPLAGVLVIIFKGEGEEAAGFEATTDEEGTFSFVDVEPGTWKVLVEADGYYPFRTSEILNDQELSEVIYFAERGSYNPFDVIVEGLRPKKEVTRRKLERKEIERIPGNYGDPIKVVQKLPGVARTSFFSPAIVVRGSSPEDTRTYADGVLVPIIYHFGGLRSIIPLGMVESIEFFPGNFSAYYGQGIGGVLDVRLKRFQPDALHGYVDVNVFDSGAYLEVPIGDDAFVAVAGRRSYIDVLLAAAVPEDAPINIISAPRYWDYQLLGNWRPTPAHELRLFIFSSDDRVELLFEDPKELDAQLQSGDFQAASVFSRIMFDHRWVPSEELENTLRLAVGNDVADASLGDQFFFRVSLLQLTLRNTTRWQASKETAVVFGVDALTAITDAELRAPRPRKEGDPDRFQNRDLSDTITLEEKGTLGGGTAAFMELELSQIDNLLVVPGVRVEQLEPIDSVVFDPRLTVRYDLSPQWTVKGGVGLYHQPPSPDETLKEFGNPDLGPEAAVHYAMGLEYQPLKHLILDVTLFYKDMFDLVSRTGETTTTETGAIDAEIYNNEGEGRVYGLELLAKHEFANNFYGWIAYTLSRAERLDFGENAYRLFDFDQTHILTLIGSYQFPRNWTFGVGWRLTTGNPTTPVVGGVFNVDSDEYRQVLGEVNSARLPTFHQLDLRVDKTWIQQTWTLNVYLDIQNVYNQANVTFYQYNFDFTERRAQQNLPVLPIIGVKAEF